jgi:hypothetical protein
VVIELTSRVFAVYLVEPQSSRSPLQPLRPEVTFFQAVAPCHASPQAMWTLFEAGQACLGYQ